MKRPLTATALIAGLLTAALTIAGIAAAINERPTAKTPEFGTVKGTSFGCPYQDLYKRLVFNFSHDDYYVGNAVNQRRSIQGSNNCTYYYHDTQVQVMKRAEAYAYIRRIDEYDCYWTSKEALK